MSKSTTATATSKPAKPHKDYSLYSHATGRWAKKIRGKLHYFGPWSDPEAALNKWLDPKDDLLAGRRPRARTGAATAAYLVNHFLTHKRQLLAAGELAQRTFDRYYATAALIVLTFGKNRSVDDRSEAPRRLWLLLRTQLGRFFESFSQNGAVWTKPTPTPILSSDSPPSLTRLKDGRIVMLWNNCLRFSYAQGGRHVLHAAISEDDGRAWRGYREAARNPFVDEPPPPNGDHGVSYTLPVLTNDGDIITPLSVGGTAGMWLLRFNPEWLYETSRKTDFSSGAEGWNSFGTKGVEVVANPDKPGARALQLCKPEADWPSAAVWNFPNGMNGRLQIRLKLNPGFPGARIGLTDHFSVAFDPEDQYYNLFNLSIGPEGKLQRSEITIAQWHTLELDWNCAKQECRVYVDGRPAETLPMQRRTAGVNYLRLCSTVEEIDAAGLLIESVDASLSE